VLERELPPPLACLALTRNLGQDLFAPPNVKGWDGGLSWITTNTLLARYNEAATLIQGDVSMFAGAGMANRPNMNRALERRVQNVQLRGVNVAKLFPTETRTSQEKFIDSLEKRLLQAKLQPRQEKTLLDFLQEQSELNDEAVASALRLAMSTPEYQLT
jgi:hypothetical protein